MVRVKLLLIHPHVAIFVTIIRGLRVVPIAFRPANNVLVQFMEVYGRMSHLSKGPLMLFLSVHVVIQNLIIPSSNCLISIGLYSFVQIK